MMKLKTNKRLYRIEPLRDAAMNVVGWDATYKPINPKTNTPWQASRSVPGWDAHILVTCEGSVRLVEGEAPPFSQWGSAIQSCRRAYLSEASALSAVKAYDPEATPIE